VRASSRRRYPTAPLVGVGGLITKGDRILVVKRENDPGKGLWSIPGGLLEVGETIQEGVKREIREETGLDVEVVELLDVIDSITCDEAERVCFHYVLIDFLCRVTRGKLSPDTDVKEAQWVRVDDLENIPTTRTLTRLLKKMGEKGRPTSA
jgi:ADP-ribose pyrophosphatase YjhB (NUDIX family)